MRILFILLLAAAPLGAQLSPNALPTTPAQAPSTAQPAAPSASSTIAIPAELKTSFKNLLGSFGLSQLDLAKTAKDALSALGQGKDGSTLSLLDKIQAAGLNETQMGLLKDLKIAVDQYVLQRNFSGIPAFEGPVKNVLASLTTADPDKIGAELKNLLHNTSPNEEQKSLLTTMLAQYETWMKD